MNKKMVTRATTGHVAKQSIPNEGTLCMKSTLTYKNNAPAVSLKFLAKGLTNT